VAQPGVHGDAEGKILGDGVTQAVQDATGNVGVLLVPDTVCPSSGVDPVSWRKNVWFKNEKRVELLHSFLRT
jgi:hypothetical protein